MGVMSGSSEGSGSGSSSAGVGGFVLFPLSVPMVPYCRASWKPGMAFWSVRAAYSASLDWDSAVV